MKLSTLALQLEKMLKSFWRIVLAVPSRNTALLVPMRSDETFWIQERTIASSCSFVLVLVLIETARDRPDCKLPVTASCVARLDLDAEGVVS